MSNLFINVSPPAVRRVVYAVYGFVGVVLTIVQIVLSSMHLDQPDWLTAALAVFAVLGGALGATAASNTQVPAADPATVGAGASPSGTA